MPFELTVDLDLTDLIKQGISPQISVPDALDFGGFGEKALDYLTGKGAGYLNDMIQNLIGNSLSLGDKEVKFFALNFDIGASTI